MSIPPSPVLLAALRWMQYLSHTEMRKVRALFTSHSEFSDLTPSQYSAGLAWLEALGLVVAGQRQPVERQLNLALYSSAIAGSLWLGDSDLLVASARELPSDAERAAVALGISVDDAFGMLHEVAGKVDAAERSRLGRGGELAVVDWLQRNTVANIRHVAEISDGYGYDISATLKELAVHLEVKSTTRKGRLTVYLSRHEFETMRRDRDWQMLAVRLDQDLQMRSMATVSKEWLSSVVPADRVAQGRWESVRLQVPAEALTTGLVCIPASPETLDHATKSLVPEWPG